MQQADPKGLISPDLIGDPGVNQAEVTMVVNLKMVELVVNLHLETDLTGRMKKNQGVVSEVLELKPLPSWPWIVAIHGEWGV
ncbi:MAG: hypothetical protein VKL98_10000 [Cyanobacteriota bacterium]|nr:hypothetical protein [Cyanobacteriota bacterium]